MRVSKHGALCMFSSVEPHACLRACYPIFLRFERDIDFVVVVIVMPDPSTDQGGPLEYESGDEEVEPHATEAVLLEEGHEESEPNEHHHVDVLEHWNGKKVERSWNKTGIILRGIVIFRNFIDPLVRLVLK